MKQESVQSVQPLGNTRLKAEKLCSASKKWCFTFNNYSEKDYEDTMCAISKTSNRWIIGKEKGETNGTEHLQGYAEFNERIRPTALKLSKKIHWEKCKGDDVANYKYCSKENNFQEQGFSKAWKIQNKLQKIKTLTELTDWQKEFMDLYEQYKENDRKIVWIYGKKGGEGKTSLAKWLYVNKDFGYLTNAKTADISYYVTENIKEAYVFDFSRTTEGHINYQALENLKNGLLFSSKYESSVVCMDNPFIVCFSNWEPEYTALSDDRWIVREIMNDSLEIRHSIIKLSSLISGSRSDSATLSRPSSPHSHNYYL